MKKEQNIWILLRFTMSFILLWAFFDKLFGLGFSTQPGKAWIDGVLPTTGFLQWGVHGPLAFFYNNISSSQIVYVLVFIGLTFVKPGHCCGLGKWWSKTKLVKKYTFLE